MQRTSESVDLKAQSSSRIMNEARCHLLVERQRDEHTSTHRQEHPPRPLLSLDRSSDRHSMYSNNHEEDLKVAYKYLILGPVGWPIGGGRTLIVPGTTVDTSLPQWSNLPLSGFPPRGAQCLDQVTYDAAVSQYGHWAVLYGPGITPATSGGPLKCGTSSYSLQCAL